MSNFFSAPWFLETAGDLLFAGSGARPATVELDARCFDVLVFPNGRVATSRLIDFFEPVEADGRPTQAVRYLPAVALAPVPVGTALGRDDRGSTPAPLVDWSAFQSWEAFVSFASARDWRAFDQPGRKVRKVEREHGPVRFARLGHDVHLLERMLLWKSQQLRRSGGLDRFVSPRVRQFVHRLVANGHLILSAMFAGERPLAIQLGHWGASRYSCWITAFDPQCSSLSPGALLSEWQLRSSWEAGHKEFDFLVGDEAYKYYYATHERRVRSLGAAPLAAHGFAWARGFLGSKADGNLDQAKDFIRGGLNRTLGSQKPAPAAQEGAACLDEIKLNNVTWPNSHISTPGNCQLILLMDSADSRLTPVAKALVRGGFLVRRGRAGIVKSLRSVRDLIRDSTRPAAVSAKRTPLRLRAGEIVRVKSAAQIRATMSDGKGPFYIPAAMSRFEGKTFVVERPVSQFYDEKTKRGLRTRDTVLLSGSRCDGSQLGEGHACDRGCLLFWREVWLERAPALDPAPAVEARRVRVKPLSEIQALVQQSSGNDGLPFVPETMGAFAGRTFPVLKDLRSAHDERQGHEFPVKGVVLEGVFCPGAALSGGGLCDRSCALFWREEWLDPA